MIDYIMISTEELKLTVGRFEKCVKNTNEKIMIDICIIGMANTFCQHKEIYKFAREMKSRN